LLRTLHHITYYYILSVRAIVTKFNNWWHLESRPWSISIQYISSDKLRTLDTTGVRSPMHISLDFVQSTSLGTVRWMDSSTITRKREPHRGMTENTNFTMKRQHN